MNNWWITMGPLPDGEKIAGPYGSDDDAVEARRVIEVERAPETFWVASEEVTAVR